ncbi:hypothetical protein GDO78_014067, partial [Eleutherodactylus coqui]
FLLLLFYYVSSSGCKYQEKEYEPGTFSPEPNTNCWCHSDGHVKCCTKPSPVQKKSSNSEQSSYETVIIG